MERLTILAPQTPGKSWAITDGVLVLPLYASQEAAECACRRNNAYRTRLAYEAAYRQIRKFAQWPPALHPLPLDGIEEAAQRSYRMYWGG